MKVKERLEKLFQTERNKIDMKLNEKYDSGMDGMDPFAKRTLLDGV